MVIENKSTNSLPRCLIIPIAAKSIQSIEKFVGLIVEKSKDDKWCYVNFKPLEKPNEYDVWKHPRANLITQPLQCWVSTDYTRYRSRYKACFKEFDFREMVIDHIMNRRFGRALGFKFVRLIHVERSINSSSGRGVEYDVINYKNPLGLSKFSVSKNEISYADPADLMKMLNMKVGAFPLNNLRDNLDLFYPKTAQT